MTFRKAGKPCQYDVNHSMIERGPTGVLQQRHRDRFVMWLELTVINLEVSSSRRGRKDVRT
jgi:hypothetical protein